MTLSIAAGWRLAGAIGVIAPALVGAWLLGELIPLWPLIGVIVLAQVLAVIGLAALVTRRHDHAVRALERQLDGLLVPGAHGRALASAAAASAVEPELGGVEQRVDAVRMERLRLVEERDALQARLNERTMLDALTGLPTRALLRQVFPHHAAAARRSNQPMALLHVDLDRFRAINDVLGQTAGDEVLAIVGRRLSATLRESDVVCRVSDDEFAVLLPDAHGWDAVAATADRLLAALRVTMQLPRLVATAQVRASIGIAMYPADGSSFEALAHAAASARDRSQSLGGDRIAFYLPRASTPAPAAKAVSPPGGV